jgi:N-acetylglucosamine-6-sulfatase
MRRLRTVWLLVGVLVLGVSTADAAQCTTRDEARTLGKSIRKRIACAQRAFRAAPSGSCLTPPAPPACGAAIVDNVVALAFGDNNPPASTVDRRAMRDQLRCQKQIGKAVGKFVSDKLKHLVRGASRLEAETKARRQLDKLPDRCGEVPTALDASGVVVPDVGTTCQGTIDSPAAAFVDADALRACLFAALETLVDTIAPAPPPRPNLIIILTDDQRGDTTDATHSLDGVTPIMPNVENRLAAAGVKFTRGFVSTALCCPSRSSLLKGQFAHTTGVLTNNQPLGGAKNFDDSSSLATWLDGQGYHTGLFGKYLNGYNTLWTPPATPYVPPGWDEWHAFEQPRYYDFTLIEKGADFPATSEVTYASTCTNYAGCPADQAGEDPCPSPQNYATDVLLAKALDFLDDSAGQPFFLYVAPYAPHAPFCAAPGDENLFASLPGYRPPNWNAEPSPDAPLWVQNICPMGPNKQNNIDNDRRKQLASLQAVDRGVGAILDKLVALGQDQNTLIVFTGDNGYSWGSHCHRPKRCPYEECSHVPMIVSYPPLTTPARVDTRLALNLDIAFTFAEAAGLVPPVQQDGRSMLRLLDDVEPTWRTDFLYEQWLDGDPEDNDTVPPTLACVRNEQFKWIEYETGETELYDLVADPYELQNLTNDAGHADVKAELQTRLRQLRHDWP